MGKKLPAILIIGGIAIAAISIYGYRIVNTPSDAEYLAQAMRDSQAAAQAAQAEIAALRKKVLPVPPDCEPVTTRIFFETCDKEPDEGQTPPPWHVGLSEVEQRCLTGALHATNRHAFALKRQEYLAESPSDMAAIFFACDVASATILNPAIPYGTPDAAATDLLSSFFSERATTHYGPERTY